MLPNVGSGELLLILIVGLLLFGSKRIPEVARSLGQAVNAFRAGMREPYESAPTAKTETKSLPEESKT